MVGGRKPRKAPDFTARRFNTNPDQVAESRLFTEVYGKIENVPVQQSEFKYNPFTNISITQKPNNIIPSMKVSKQEFDDARKFLDEVYPIKNMDALPTEKSEVPMTMAQEYGWRSEPLVKPKKLFQHPRESCEITQYAASYYELRGVSPFASKDYVPRYVLKERAQAAAATAAAAAAAAATTGEAPASTPRDAAAVGSEASRAAPT